MTGVPLVDIPQAIKQRKKEVYKRSLYFLVPFGLTTLGAWGQAPRMLLIICFLGTWAGLALWMVCFYRLSRCPACNKLLADLFQTPLLYERCPHCHVAFKTPQ